MKSNSKNIFSSRDLFNGSGCLYFPRCSPVLIAVLVGLPHALQGFKATVDSLISRLVKTWQSTLFSAALTANGVACHGNSLVREPATYLSTFGVAQ